MKYLIYIAISYSIFVTVLFFFQRNLLYFPSNAHPKPSDWRVPDMREVTLKTQDGLSLTAWYKTAEKNKPTIIYFHGNAFHLGGRGPTVRPYLDAGFGVLLVSYRGYAGNPGKPTEEGLYNDARAAIQFVTSEKVPLDHIVLYGESLGTGIAIQMATEYPVAALVLYAPYTSITDVGQYHYFYLPVRLLLRDRFDSLSKIKNVHAPLLIIHSEQDELIPVALSKELLAAANPPKEAIFLKNLKHNDYQDMSKEVMKFISENIHSDAGNKR